MTVQDLVEFSLFVGLVVLLILLLASLVRRRPGGLRGTTPKEKLKRFGRFALVRLPIAIGFAVAVFVLGAAGLTLNSHRPPADHEPVVSVPSGSRNVVVSLRLDDCGEPIEGEVRFRSPRSRIGSPVRFYSDAGGWQRLGLTGARAQVRRASFSEEEATRKRSLLSCYLQLPILKGAADGYEVHLRLSDQMEVEKDSSVPSPGAYASGAWVWKCGPDETCPAFAAVSYSIEDGTKQVIILVLASVFGALIALLVGEVLIEWARKRFREPD